MKRQHQCAEVGRNRISTLGRCPNNLLGSAKSSLWPGDHGNQQSVEEISNAGPATKKNREQPNARGFRSCCLNCRLLAGRHGVSGDGVAAWPSLLVGARYR